MWVAIALIAARCDTVATLQHPDATITSARTVAAGQFTLPSNAPRSDSSFFSAFGSLPAFCRVQGTMKPSRDSAIDFEVWLPESAWNGKYVGAGNGGFGGNVNYYRLAEAVNAGYVGSATDTGHKGASAGRAWVAGHPASVIDFDSRAIHLTAAITKAIVQAFYGESPSRSYFNGCSTGGRQALMEAQRYPADYDGILAGAPAFFLGRSVTPTDLRQNPDVAAFHARGGKLILYHGANDGPADTIAYYRRVVARLGDATAVQFLRLFVVPDMGHCGGGPVPEFGARVTPRGDADHSMFAALERWVERGVAPDRIVAIKYNVDDAPATGVMRTRPLCAYPQRSRWTGNGAEDDASNYVCVPPAK